MRPGGVAIARSSLRSDRARCRRSVSWCDVESSLPIARHIACPKRFPAPIRLRFADFEPDEANAWLLRDGKAVALAPTPFTLLCALARRPDALFTKDALLDAVCGHRGVTESALKTAISDLRTAGPGALRRPRPYIDTPTARPEVPCPPSPCVGRLFQATRVTSRMVQFTPLMLKAFTA